MTGQEMNDEHKTNKIKEEEEEIGGSMKFEIRGPARTRYFY
jgi:hypothetical protein